MAKKDLPDIKTLRQLFRYEPETGKLYWLPRTPEMCIYSKYPKRTASTFNSNFAGKEVGYITHQGYREFELFGYSTSVHIVCWYLFKGYISNFEIDHINGNKLDNRILNLREATDSQQMANLGISVRNTSGVKGVFKMSKNKWRVQITVDRKKNHIGCFDNFDEAVAARKAAEAKYQGEYSRKG